MSFISLNLSLNVVMPLLMGVTLVRFLAMWHYSNHRRVYPGFRTLVVSELMVFLVLVVGMLRAAYGEVLPLVLMTSVGPLLQPILAFHGFGQYGRLPRLQRHARIGAGLAVLVFLYMLADQLFAPDINRRVVVFSLASVLLTLRVALVLPFKCPRRLPGLWLLSASYLLVAGLHALRGGVALGGADYNYTLMLNADRLLGAYVFVRVLQSVLEMYVVFSMNSAMLEDELLTATAQIERMAHTDALTGVANRRGLELLGEQVLRQSSSRGRPSSLIMLDLDHFKRVNDTLGHAAGDELLRAVSALCADSLRKEDVFARYGGEEFVVVAPNTYAPQAELLAERMRRRVEAERFAATKGAPVTASFGVVSAVGVGLEALLKKADEALYEAKQTGRNKVVVTEYAPEEEDGARR